MSASQVVRNVIAVLIIVGAVAVYVFFRAPILPSDFDAMEPVYPAGSRFLVNVRDRAPSAGDDVYYRYEYQGATARQIGRVVAGPGETVRLGAGNRTVWDRFEKDVEPETGATVGIVPEGTYYILRLKEDSDLVDSRNFGPVPAANVIGKVVTTLPF